jgi:hypothetical protein
MHMSAKKLIATFMCGMVVALSTAEQWTIYKPGNTGIGGNLVEGFRLDPSGRPWVGARYPIQQDGGVSMYDGAKWTNYSNVDNLMPSEFVYAMAFAPDGTKWFGTDVGLVHHYGDHFVLYNSSNTPLPKNVIRSVQVDAAGNVWMVYWNPGFIFTGVARFNGTTWTIWPHNSSLGFGDTIMLDRLEIAPNGNVWVGSNSAAGLARWNGTSWSRVLPGTGATGPFNPYLGRDGRMWVLTQSDVRVLNGTSWLTKPLPASGPTDWTALHAMPDGTYFVGNWAGLLAYNNGSTWQSMVTPAAVMRIETNAAGELWWVSLKRLYKFVSWGSWRVFHSGNTGLTEYFSQSLTFDTVGNLWVGTAGGGACSFNGTIWRGFNPHNDGSEPWGLPTDYVGEILGAKDGSVWIATGNSAARFNGTSWTQYGYGFMSEDVAESSTGLILSTWDINTEAGYGTFNGTGFNRVNLMVAPVYGGSPKDIYVDGAGKIFYGTQTGLVTNETGSWVRIDMAPIVGSINSVANCVTKAPNGDLWVGTANGAARRRNGIWTVFRESNSGIPANVVHSITVRADGLVAIGAFDGTLWPYHGGVATYNGTTWTKWTYGNSRIQHEQVEDVKFDKNGNMWIVSQSEGIAKITLGSGSGSALSSLVATPNALAAGLTTTGQVTLTGPAPAGGVMVNVVSNSPLAIVPATVTIPQGATTTIFSVKTGKVVSDTTVAISVSAGGLTKSAQIILQHNNAGYVGQMTALQMVAGQRYSVSVSYRNMGSSTWTDGSGFRLASRSPADNTTFGTNRLRLNPVLAVRPNELGNFTGTATAPITPGTYLWQWKPLLNGVGTFGDESTPYPITVTASTNASQFVSQSVPASVKAGATFTASVTMKNVGSATWTNAVGYRMQSRNPTDNMNWSTNRMYLSSSASVASGASYTFTQSFKAPSVPGTHNFQWKMLLNGAGSFGETSPNVVISVNP